MRRLATLLAALLLAACANMGTPTPSGVLAASYRGIESFHQLVGQTVARGRISSEQAFKLIDHGDRVRGNIDLARNAFVLCGEKLPCSSYDEIIKRLQPMLAELELRLREEEARKAR